MESESKREGRKKKKNVIPITIGSARKTMKETEWGNEREKERKREKKSTRERANLRSLELLFLLRRKKKIA